MYKILSLDGGGSWAILQLLTLKERYSEQTTGHEILRDYDMVIANSGGSIILTALAENYTIAKAISLFDVKSNREMIFSRNRFKERYFPVDYLQLFTSFGPKYSMKRKREAFEALFPTVNRYQMDQLPALIGKEALKIIVCTYDALNNRAKFFRSFGQPGDYDSVRLTQAAHGSSNAPIQYFDFPARFKAKESNVFFELWDGALGGFNNPVAAGIIEAIKCGVDKDDIMVVSIGNGNSLMSLEEKKVFYDMRDISTRERGHKWKLWRLKYQFGFFKTSILNQAKTILYQPPDWANYVAYMLLFDKNHGNIANMKRFIRLSPMVHIDKNVPAETHDLLMALNKLDMDLTKDEDIDKIKQCFENWRLGKIHNQPIEYKVLREDNTLVPLIGHRTFRDGMADWL